MNRVYLDFAASTPVDPEVERAMRPYFCKIYGNPGALHRFGQEASAAVFKARDVIAGALGCSYKEIVFTGSATEANNLAIRGVVAACGVKKPKIIVSAIEHESVLETCRDLERRGVEVFYAPVSREGIVDVKKIGEALNERTVLVSVMYANNEIGTLQPIAEIARLIGEYKKSKLNDPRLSISPYPLFHTDAVQAYQYLPCKTDELGVDLLTLSAHKIYGPKGIGALYARQLAKEKVKTSVLAPIITGGGQERGLRSGTENIPYIVGFAKAVELTEAMRQKEITRVIKLRDFFWNKIKKMVKNAEMNGSEKQRLPNNLNVYFPGHNAGDILIALDVKGVAASPGAACHSHAAKESYVVSALGHSLLRASQSLRFSLGRGITKKDIDTAISVIKNIFVR